MRRKKPNMTFTAINDCPKSVTSLRLACKSHMRKMTEVTSTMFSVTKPVGSHKKRKDEFERVSERECTHHRTQYSLKHHNRLVLSLIFPATRIVQQTLYGTFLCSSCPKPHCTSVANSMQQNNQVVTKAGNPKLFQNQYTIACTGSLAKILSFFEAVQASALQTSRSKMLGHRRTFTDTDLMLLRRPNRRFSEVTGRSSRCHCNSGCSCSVFSASNFHSGRMRSLCFVASAW
mmetsp:Transcript_22283/g.55723  ORF Transcript_22283/g.55723 Transcript_22283/m.55723 type:complete len:232 (-) Transcript_22283:804-1499(-)